MLPRSVKIGRQLGMLLGSLVFWASVQAADDILPPEQAFPYEVAADGNEITVEFQIPEGYYLYRERFSFDSPNPGVLLGGPEFPKGKIYEDEFFGAMEIYRGAVAIPIPYVNDAGATELDLKLGLQGCADIGICYPPQKWVRTVSLPGETVTSDNPLAALLSGGARNGKDPLPVEEAFALDFRVDSANELTVSWRIEPGYYLYKDKFAFTTDSTSVQLGPASLARGSAENR